MDEIKQNLEHAAERLAEMQDTLKSEFTFGDKTESLWKLYEGMDEAYYSVRLALNRLEKFEPDVRTDITELFSG